MRLFLDQIIEDQQPASSSSESSQASQDQEHLRGFWLTNWIALSRRNYIPSRYKLTGEQATSFKCLTHFG